MVASQPLAGGEEEKESSTIEHQAGKNALEAGGVLIFNMFFYQGLLAVYGLKTVGVLPMLKRPSLLGVGEAVLGDIRMDNRPGNGQRAEPEGEFGHSTVGQRLELMDLDEDRGWDQLFQNTGVMVKAGNGRERGANDELIFKTIHSQKYIPGRGF